MASETLLRDARMVAAGTRSSFSSVRFTCANTVLACSDNSCRSPLWSITVTARRPFGMAMEARVQTDVTRQTRQSLNARRVSIKKLARRGAEPSLLPFRGTSAQHSNLWAPQERALKIRVPYQTQFTIDQLSLHVRTIIMGKKSRQESKSPGARGRGGSRGGSRGGRGGRGRGGSSIGLHQRFTSAAEEYRERAGHGHVHECSCIFSAPCLSCLFDQSGVFMPFLCILFSAHLSGSAHCRAARRRRPRRLWSRWRKSRRLWSRRFWYCRLAAQSDADAGAARGHREGIKEPAQFCHLFQ